MFKRIILGITMVMLSIFPFLQSVQAEGNTGGVAVPNFPYTSMQIQVMPEFDYPENYPKDQPVLLVGYYGTMKNTSGKDFNSTIEFPLPVNEKSFQIYIVAEFPEENQPEVQREFKIDKEKGVATWTPSKPIKAGEEYKFVVEFYVNPIAVKDANKSFTFEYNPTSNIDALDILFYAPVNSKGFKSDIAPTNTTQTEYGEQLLMYQYKDVKSDDAKKFNVSYEKKGNESTLSNIQTNQPPKDDNHSGVAEGGGTPTTPASQPIIDGVGATIIGLGLAIMGFFIYLGLRNRGNTQVRNYSKNETGRAKEVKSQNKKVSNNGIEAEKKKLRKMLLNGEISQDVYEEKVSKLEK